MNDIKHIIAVASGKGGVGKSTTAVNLALALRARGGKVGLLDADVYGPSQQMMLGVPIDLRPEQQGGEFLLPIEAHGLKTTSMGYLVNDRTPMVWRGPMAGGALAQMLEQTLWGELDYLVIDMPPGTGDIQLTLSQKAQVSGAVIVTTPQDIALQDAQKGIEMFRKVNVPILGVIENMAVHICSRCGPAPGPVDPRADRCRQADGHLRAGVGGGRPVPGGGGGSRGGTCRTGRQRGEAVSEYPDFR